MNYRLVVQQLSLLIIVLSAILALIAAWAFEQWKWGLGGAAEADAFWALLISAGGGFAGGSLSWLLARQGNAHLGRREALLLVALSWIIGAALAAMPFLIWAHLHEEAGPDHPMRSFVDCYFEAMSGLTTTGATILPDIQSLPRSLLLWRALTHWLGGLGIVVLFVAVLPSLGAGGKRLFRVESPGPVPEGVRPQVRDTARVLWFIYLGLTAIAIIAYRSTGAMDWFDSVCHTFSVVSTGGLSTRDASIGYYDSVAVDVVTIVFMVLAGVNFALFYQMTLGRFRQVWKDTELRVYLVSKLLVIVLVVGDLHGEIITTTTGDLVGTTFWQAVRYSSFTTVALHTGTGFGTADYDLWPYLSLVLLIGLMFVGGCAGSTAGGAKVIRFWIAIKVMVAELEKAFRPNVVRPIKIGNTIVDPELKLAALGYLLIMLLLLGVGTAVLPLLEPEGSPIDFPTAASASLSTLCNIGPGLHAIGPTKNYEWFSPGNKLVLTGLMALGRLEIFALLVLFSPRFWRRD